MFAAIPASVTNNKTAFTAQYDAGEEITVPVAHNEGNYFADDNTLKRLQDEDCIAFTYADGDNPNGACLDIVFATRLAGLGMMPHPERRAEAALWRRRQTNFQVLWRHYREPY